MKHPIYRIASSIVLGAIVLYNLYALFAVIPSDIKAVQEVNYYKLFVYTVFIIGGVVGVLLLNTKMK